MKNIQKPQETAEFEIGELLGIVMTFVVLGIGLTYGLTVMSDVRNDTDKYTCLEGYTYFGSASNATVGCYPTNTTYTSPSDYLNVSIAGTTNVAYTAAGQTVTGVSKFGAKLGLIVTVIIAAVIIGVLVRYLWVR